MKDLFNKFIHFESLSGCLLILTSIVALGLANSPWESTYSSFVEGTISFNLSKYSISTSFHHIINDGLMVLFFLLIGLEIKREMIEGKLSKISQMVLPLLAALGGIAVPALIFTVFNYKDPIIMKGWAIPTATDIAFALGIVALLGSRVPSALKLFIMTVAIYDDLAAIIIIAFFYTGNLSLLTLAFASFAILALGICNHFNISKLSLYLAIGSVLWLLVLKSGVHATLAGVILAFAIPLKLPHKRISPLKLLENKLYPWVSYCILPLFAFANAGVNFQNIGINELFSPLTVGISMGLFVGKQLGIFFVCLAVIKLKFASLPENVSWQKLYGAAMLCGIGFTMSLFISTLAYQNETLLTINSRLGIFIGTLLSAIAGSILLLHKGKKDLPTLS